MKILEEFIDGARCINTKGELTDGFCDCQRYVEEDTYQAIENLIKEFKKAKIENIEYKLGQTPDTTEAYKTLKKELKKKCK